MTTTAPAPGTGTGTSAAPRTRKPYDAYNPLWQRTDPYDRELFERFLRSFVPPNSFDAHAHCYELTTLLPQVPVEEFEGRTQIGHQVFLDLTRQWMGDRTINDGLFFPYPAKLSDPHKGNAFLASELAKVPGSRGLMMVTPKDHPAQVEAEYKKHGFAGFKVYHIYADRKDTGNAEQGEFLPEWVWELSERYGSWITMHMVLPRAIADVRNQRYIREHCMRYPNAKMVLAHAARSFCSNHAVEGVESLRGLDNVFFDTSAVCEAAAFEAILKVFGTTRLMYGSDFGVSQVRGKAITVNDGFLWVSEFNSDWEPLRTMGKDSIIGVESLMALKQACRTMHMTDSDVERLFSTNARQLLGLQAAPTGQKVQATYRLARSIIPGGTQLLSKRPEMFAPEQWPAYYEQAIGCEIVDTDGRKFIDMSLGGILATILGYSDPDVNAAVIRRVQLGSMATLQTADEVEVAQLMLKIHPWAGMARFARTGGEAMAVAVRIARASTGRDKVAICGYHGWHDWYLAANLGGVDDGGKTRLDGHLLPGLDPKGVPRGLAGTAFTFQYNKLDQLDQVIAKHGKEMAAIVMETTRGVDPDPGFLEGVRQRASLIGAKLIFDEISIGWRLCLGGAHLKFGVNPDLAVFAKTISNGFAMSAVIGNTATMQAAQESFISSAYWTEGVGPAAAVAAIKKMMRMDVPAHLEKIGRMVMDGWAELGRKHNIALKVTGRPSMATFTFDVAGQEVPVLATFFIAKMLQQGFLAGVTFNPMLAHQTHHIEAYLEAVDEVFGELTRAIQANDVKARIGGPVKHTGFARLTS